MKILGLECFAYKQKVKVVSFSKILCNVDFNSGFIMASFYFLLSCKSNTGCLFLEKFQLIYIVNICIIIRLNSFFQLL